MIRREEYRGAYIEIFLSSLTTGELLGFRDIKPSLQHHKGRSITPRNGYGRLCTMVANCLRWRACGFVVDDVLPLGNTSNRLAFFLILVLHDERGYDVTLSRTFWVVCGPSKICGTGRPLNSQAARPTIF